MIYNYYFMKNINLWLSALVLATIPLFSSQALITKPNVQFKTLEQIQADALEKLNADSSTLSPRQLRQKRLLNFTKDNSLDVNRARVGQFENRVNVPFRSERRTTGRNQGVRTSTSTKAGKFTSRRTLTEDELSVADKNLTLRQRLIQRRAEQRAIVEARNSSRRHVSNGSDTRRRDRLRALSRQLSGQTFNSESEFENRTFTNDRRRSSFDFVPQPGQIWGR